MKHFKYMLFCTLLFTFLLAADALAAEYKEDKVLVVMKPRAVSLMSENSSAYSFGSLKIADCEKIGSLQNNSLSLFSLGRAEKEILCLTLEETGIDKVSEATQYLNSLSTVEWAQPDYIYHLDSTPNDTGYSDQYSLPLISAPKVWDLDIDCSETVVAVIDSGVNLTHEDLKANLWTGLDGKKGYDFANDDAIPEDNIGHGTHVAGIISAETNNRKGVASVARNAKIAVLKAFDSSTGSSSTVIKAMNYITSYEKKYGKTFSVVNMSFGVTENNMGSDDLLLHDKIAECSDIVFTVSAGNSSVGQDMDTVTSQRMYPASFELDNILSVACSNSSDTLAYNSNYGKSCVDIAAPGENIVSTYGVISSKKYTPSNAGYAYMSGTSMAAPLTASAVAALRSICPYLTANEAISYILEGADYVETLDGYIAGGRRLNAYKPIELALMPSSVSPDGQLLEFLNIDASLSDEGGNEVTAGSMPREINADIDVSVKGSMMGVLAMNALGSFDVIIAAYDGEGMLVSAGSSEVNADNVTVEPVTLEIPENTEIGVVKMLLWKSMGSMKPLDEAIYLVK